MSTVQSQFSFARVTSAINAAIAAATPADGSISLAKLATQATGTILGNNSGSNASPSALSASAARTVLGLATTDSPTFAGLNSSGSSLLVTANTSNAATISATGSVFRNSISIGLSGLSPIVSLVSTANNIIEQRNGTNGQIARWFKTFTSATNAEWCEIDAAGNASNFDIAACIGSAGGVARGIRIGGKNAAGVFTPWLSFATNGDATFAGQLLGSRAVSANTASQIAANGTLSAGSGITLFGVRSSGQIIAGATAGGTVVGMDVGNTCVAASNTPSLIIGQQINLTHNANSIVTTLEGVRSQGSVIGASAVVSNWTGLRVIGPFLGSGGAVTNARGIDIDSITQGANTNFAIRTGLGLVQFGDNLNITPSTSRTLATNGQLTFERVSDTEINLVYRGNDGTTRRFALPGFA